MTTDEIVAGIDRSLAEINAERERLLAARTQLAGEPARAQTQTRVTPHRTRRGRGDTMTRVLNALDPAEPRTASDIEKKTKVGRTLAGTTLSRLVKQGKASKAKRGYLRVGS